MSDIQRVLKAAQDAGSKGIFSLDMRREGLTGDPSRRICDLEEKGFSFSKTREKQGERFGVRYVLLENVESSAGSWENGHRGSYAPKDRLDASVALGAPQPEPAQDIASEGRPKVKVVTGCVSHEGTSYGAGESFEWREDGDDIRVEGGPNGAMLLIPFEIGSKKPPTAFDPWSEFS